MENKPIKSQSRLWAAVLIICAIAGVVGIGYGANFFLRTARQTGSTASYNRPLLSLDKDPDYDGAAYQNIRLGISLDELKGQMEATHHPLSTERRKLDDVTWAYDAADKLPLANIATWRPYFRFIEDKGVERLCEIGGLLPSDYDTRNKILEVLAKKYGSGSVPANSGPSRHPIPIQTGTPFRSKPAP